MKSLRVQELNNELGRKLQYNYHYPSPFIIVYIHGPLGIRNHGRVLEV